MLWIEHNTPQHNIPPDISIHNSGGIVIMGSVVTHDAILTTTAVFSHYDSSQEQCSGTVRSHGAGMVLLWSGVM